MAHARAATALCRTLRAGVAGALASLAFAGAAGAAAIGVNPDLTWGISSTQVSQEVSLIKQAGLTWVRASVDLSGAKTSGPGQLNAEYMNGIDAAIQTARNAGLNVLIEFDRTPYWASADPNKYSDASGYHYNHYWKYTNPQQYAGVVADLVNHYKGMGVHAYEIWNEPNKASFWPSGVSASDYTSYLKAAYPAVKSADPSSTVLMGGLMNTGSYSYLQGMYNAGARGSYDVANFHIYPGADPTHCALASDGRPTESSFCLLQGLRSEMAANGDSAPGWVTELGWSTCTQSYCATQQQQADYLTAAYRLLGGSSYAWVQNAFVYGMRDLYWDTSNAAWDSSLGILNRDFSPKPAYAALQALATGTDGGSGTPSAAGPTVTLTSPASGATVSGSIPAAASASDSHGVSKVTYSVDGRVMATDSAAPYAATISLKKVADGSHTVMATAYDTAGLKVSASVMVHTGAVAATAASARRGSVALRVARASRAHRHLGLMRAFGFTTGTRGRRIVLTIQRRSKDRWLTVRTVPVAASSTGHFGRRLRLRPGRWRVWASSAGAASAARMFRVA